MVASDSQHFESGVDDRNSTRYRLSIPAVVFHQGMQLCHAKIEDFCQSGLFLVSQDKVISASLKHGSKITVQFSTSESGGSSTCSLDVEIVRISQDGIGVQLLKSAPQVIDILTKLSKQQYPSSAQKENTQALIEKRKTAELLVKLIAPRLAVLAGQCLDECYEMISNRMLSPESNHFANRYFEALSELKTNKQNLIDEFVNAQQRALTSDGDTQPEESDSEAQLSAESVLSLVDEVEFEDWLAIQEMSKRIVRRHQDVLTQLRAQLECMISVGDTEHDLVFAPLMLCSSFNEAFCVLKFESSIRVLIYPGLEEGLQQH
ncbi:MAG: DUF1631 family protein, partial [Methylococcales bacterium]